jgi:metal-responsive CopG/Arc/MetJ family transcriptional regulator
MVEYVKLEVRLRNEIIAELNEITGGDETKKSEIVSSALRDYLAERFVPVNEMYKLMKMDLSIVDREKKIDEAIQIGLARALQDKMRKGNKKH